MADCTHAVTGYMQVEGAHSFLSFGDNVPDNVIIASKSTSPSGHRLKHFIPVPGGLRPDYDANVTPGPDDYGNYIIEASTPDSQLSMSYWIDRCRHFGSVPTILMGSDPTTFAGNEAGDVCAFMIDVVGAQAWFIGARNSDYILPLSFNDSTGIYFESDVNELTVCLEPVDYLSDLTGLVLPVTGGIVYPLHTAYHEYCSTQMDPANIYHSSIGNGYLYLPSDICDSGSTPMTAFYNVGSTGLRVHDDILHLEVAGDPVVGYNIPEPLSDNQLLVVTTQGTDVKLWLSEPTSWFGVWVWNPVHPSTVPSPHSSDTSSCNTTTPSVFDGWEEISLGNDISLSTTAVNNRDSMDDHYEMIVRDFAIPIDGDQEGFYIRFNRTHHGVWDFTGGLCISMIPQLASQVVVHEPYVNNEGILTFSSFVGPLHPDQALALLPRYGNSTNPNDRISLQYGYTHPSTGEVSTRESIWSNAVTRASYNDAVSHQGSPGDTYVYFKKTGDRIKIDVYIGSQRVATGNTSPDQSWFDTGAIAFYFFAYSDHGFSATENLSSPVLGYLRTGTVGPCPTTPLDGIHNVQLRSVDFLGGSPAVRIVDPIATFATHVSGSGIDTNVDLLFDGQSATSTTLPIPSETPDDMGVVFTDGVVGMQLGDDEIAVTGVEITQIVPETPGAQDAIIRRIVLEKSMNGINGDWEVVKTWVNVEVGASGVLRLMLD